MMKPVVKMEIIFLVLSCCLLQAFVISSEAGCGWGVCSHGCQVRGNKVNCTCNEGFSMEADNFTCTSNDGRTPFLIYCQRHRLIRLDIETGARVSLVPDIKNTVALDFHFKKKMLFWTDVVDDRIWSGTMASNNLTNIKPVILSGLRNVEGVAVDWIGNKIYWVESHYNRIEVAQLNGTMRTTLVTGNMDSPRAIVVDPKWGLLFWSDWEEARPRIERVSMSGEGRKVLFDLRRLQEAGWPNGITLDYENARLYWVDAKSDSLHTVNYEGGDHRLVLRDQQHLAHPFAITTFGNYVYWTDWMTKSIIKANKWNGTNVEFVSRTRTQPFGIKAYHSSRQPDSPNPCKPPYNGGCSHLCLINSDPRLANMTYKTRAGCACPHPLRLKSDNKTCRSNETVGPPRNIRVKMVNHDPPFGTVTWDAQADAPGPIDYYWMDFGETGQAHFEERRIAGITPFTTIFAENGLEYEIRIAADIDGERGEYAVMTVQAPDSPPTAPPKNLTVTGVSPSSVNVSWDPPLESERKGKIVNYMVEWWKESDVLVRTSKRNTSDTAVTVGANTPLEPDTGYVFRVRAYTSAGAGPFTPKFKFRTYKEVDTGPYGDVPAALLNCTMTRKDNARILAPDWEEHPEINTEEECAAKCLEVPMCDSVTFTNSSKKCEIHPRRDFQFGYISEEGSSVMYQKDCPSIRDPVKNPLQHQVICPLKRGVPKPSKKYAYQLRRYRTTYEDGEYFCRRDELCAGLSYELDPTGTLFDFTLYYDATPDEGAPVSNTSAVKNCQPTGPNCGFLDAYYKKSFRNAWVYSRPTLSTNAHEVTPGDCLVFCEKDSRCYAATMIDYFEQFECKLYGSPPPGGYQLMTYPSWNDVWTWLKTPGLCTLGAGGSNTTA